MSLLGTLLLEVSQRAAALDSAWAIGRGSAYNVTAIFGLSPSGPNR
jgi:hypothetical protein